LLNYKFNIFFSLSFVIVLVQLETYKQLHFGTVRAHVKATGAVFDWGDLV